MQGISVGALSDAKIKREIESFIMRNEITTDADDVEKLILVATDLKHDYIERLSPDIFWPIHSDEWLENNKRFRTSKGGEK
jgi:hypothetical protein